MLADNIKTLFEVLSCTNSEIAKAAGCSRSYISHILNDNRNLKPTGKSIRRLAEGIYSFAEQEKLLRTLCMLTRTEEDSREALVPALITWLFEENENNGFMPTLPKRRKPGRKTVKRQEFGDRLSEVMKLLGLSNARLARMINVDDSLISRWRNGLRTPGSNRELAELLVSALFKRADGLGCEEQLLKLAGFSRKLSGEGNREELFSQWLLGEAESGIAPEMDKLLGFISALEKTEMMSVPLMDKLPKLSAKPLYWGLDGLREAVIRFLAGTAAQGGQLWLYSDENMEWLVGDESFFALWKALMAACMQRGVKICIIHNIDRSMDEMLSAIGGWMPMYMSGQIEPYVCKKSNATRFSHTFFLREGAECIYGSGIDSAGSRWYDYITDVKRLGAAKEEFLALLKDCMPLIRFCFTEEQKALLRARSVYNQKNVCTLLAGLSVAALPLEELSDCLKKAGVEKGLREKVLATVAKRQKELFEEQTEQVYEMVVLPDESAILSDEIPLFFSMELFDLDLSCKREVFLRQLERVYELILTRKNYHLLLLPQLPFADIQIVMTEGRVDVIRSKAPCAAFSFTDPYLIQAFYAYFDSLKKHFPMDRANVRRILKKYLKGE